MIFGTNDAVNIDSTGWKLRYVYVAKLEHVSERQFKT